MSNVLIRCINIKSNKVKNMYPSIASNKQLMKTMGWQISDPDYQAKMEAYKAKKPFPPTNGKADEPKREAFAPELLEPQKPEKKPKAEAVTVETAQQKITPEKTPAQEPKKRGPKPKNKIPQA